MSEKNNFGPLKSPLTFNCKENRNDYVLKHKAAYLHTQTADVISYGVPILSFKHKFERNHNIQTCLYDIIKGIENCEKQLKTAKQEVLKAIATVNQGSLFEIL